MYKSFLSLFVFFVFVVVKLLFRHNVLDVLMVP